MITVQPDDLRQDVRVPGVGLRARRGMPLAIPGRLDRVDREHHIARGDQRLHPRPTVRLDPDQHIADLIVQGIHLVGGGGMLRGLDQRLTDETDVQVRLVDLPLECVALGAGRCIESYEAAEFLFLDDTRR